MKRKNNTQTRTQVPHWIYPSDEEENEQERTRKTAVSQREPVFVHSGDDEDEDDNDDEVSMMMMMNRRTSGARGLSLRGGPRKTRRRINRRKRKYGYVCRGRIGRGGRYVLDRLRVPISKRRKEWHRKREDRNRPDLEDPSVKMMLERSRTVYARPPHRVLMITGASDLSQIVNPDQEQDTQNDFDQDEEKRREQLDQIYAMSDSEDERVMPQIATFGVEGTVPSQKRVKFVLEV